MQKHAAQQQFEKHIRENELLIYKVCRVYTHNEADRQVFFQEVVIQLRLAFPKFKGQSKFSTWLYRVAINTAITGLRKQKDIIAACEPAMLPQRMADSTCFEEGEQLQLLYKAIEQSNEVEKAIVVLYMEDRTYEEMEDILGLSQGNLRVKMSRIKDKLRQLTKTI